MTDYSRKTRQGYVIVAYYLNKRNDVIAVFFRPSKDDYGLAYDYDVRTGTWNRGVYDLTSQEAHQILRQDKADMINDINNIFSVVFAYNNSNIYDTFGIFDTSYSFVPMFKMAYKVAKSRYDEPIAIRNLWRDTYGVAYKDGQSVRLDWNGKKYRLMQDGHFGGY